jgi:hypothetical protein
MTHATPIGLTIAIAPMKRGNDQCVIKIPNERYIFSEKTLSQTISFPTKILCAHQR